MGEYIVLRQPIDQEFSIGEDGGMEATEPAYDFIIVDVVNGIGDITRAITAPDEGLAVRVRDLLNGEEAAWEAVKLRLQSGQPP